MPGCRCFGERMAANLRHRYLNGLVRSWQWCPQRLKLAGVLPFLCHATLTGIMRHSRLRDFKRKRPKRAVSVRATATETGSATSSMSVEVRRLMNAIRSPAEASSSRCHRCVQARQMLSSGWHSGSTCSGTRQSSTPQAARELPSLNAAVPGSNCSWISCWWGASTGHVTARTLPRRMVSKAPHTAESPSAAYASTSAAIGSG
mmetsp:Transcript_77583/g.141095  ORF Transcript_77583/g.141095 Transcript_77583/m.141095 type:complete len:203 (+) Transcript_77583:244-852(+)